MLHLLFHGYPFTLFKQFFKNLSFRIFTRKLEGISVLLLSSMLSACFNWLLMMSFLPWLLNVLIRFYPIVLRYVFSTDCIKQQQSLDTWVIGSMTVSCVLSFYLFYLVNKACLDVNLNLTVRLGLDSESVPTPLIILLSTPFTSL